MQDYRLFNDEIDPEVFINIDFVIGAESVSSLAQIHLSY
jgi:hypothetical protein